MTDSTRWRVLACLFLGVLSLAGCEGLLQPQGWVTGGAGGPSMGEAMAMPYNGPRARLAVVAFDNKTGKGERIGDGMADMLTTELFNSNRYVMLEREQLGAVIAEQDLAADGKVSPATAAPTGQIEGAELLVKGALTEFEPDRQGTGGVIASRKYHTALTFNLKQAHLAMDLRVIDARTSRVVAATTVTGRASDIGLGLITRIGGGSTRMPIGLSTYRNTPMEKAIRVCIARAVQFIVSRTPAQYYHYDATGQPLPTILFGTPTTYAAPAARQLPPDRNFPAPPVYVPQVTPKPAPPRLATASSWPTDASPHERPAQYVHVALDTALVFERANAHSPAVAALTRGTALHVQGANGPWYAVVLADGRKGWILQSFTSPTPTQ